MHFKQPPGADYRNSAARWFGYQFGWAHRRVVARRPLASCMCCPHSGGRTPGRGACVVPRPTPPTHSTRTAGPWRPQAPSCPAHSGHRSGERACYVVCPSASFCAPPRSHAVVAARRHSPRRRRHSLHGEPSAANLPTSSACYDGYIAQGSITQPLCVPANVVNVEERQHCERCPR